VTRTCFGAPATVYTPGAMACRPGAEPREYVKSGSVSMSRWWVLYREDRLRANSENASNPEMVPLDWSTSMPSPMWESFTKTYPLAVISESTRSAIMDGSEVVSSIEYRESDVAEPEKGRCSKHSTERRERAIVTEGARG